MISFITGKPGDGKTLFAVRQIVEDLVDGHAYIVTNIPLKMRELREHVCARLAKSRPDEIFDLDSRIKIIPGAEVYEFYRHRAGGLVLGWSPDHDAVNDGIKRLDRPAFVKIMEDSFLTIKDHEAAKTPVHYYIDEAHDFFSSREWATNGRGTLFYASKHRHLHDNVFLITQVMENVEKQLRGLCSETHMVRNQLRRRIGPIAMRPIFKVSSFYGVPTGSVKPYAITNFSIDLKGVASCYKTAGALGIHDKGEAIKNKASLPWWVLPVGGAALVISIFGAMAGFPLLAAKMGAGIVGGALSPDKKLPVSAPSAPSLMGRILPGQVAQVQDYQPPVPRDQFTGAGPILKSEDSRPIYIKGFITRGGRINVHLSDGRIITEADGTLRRIERNFVEFTNGQRLWLQGAGGESPPDKRRDSSAAVGLAALRGRNPTATAGDNEAAGSFAAPLPVPSLQPSQETSEQFLSRARTAPSGFKARDFPFDK